MRVKRITSAGVDVTISYEELIYLSESLKHSIRTLKPRAAYDKEAAGVSKKYTSLYKRIDKIIKAMS